MRKPGADQHPADEQRGITIAFMILVNDPGDWSHVYAQLDHSKWNGWTLTDLVFPNFLFLVGAAIIFSLNTRLRRGVGGTSQVRDLRRISAPPTQVPILRLRRAAPRFASGAGVRPPLSKK